MYAAAGGASLASRQARQRQRQNKKNLNKQVELKPHQAKQYHNYTDDQAPVALPPAPPKLSRVERGALKPPQGHERRHSASHYHLKEPSAGKGRLRESPSISIPVQSHPPPVCSLVDSSQVLSSSPTLQQLPQILIPEGDGRLERRCSFVRQVEEMEKCQEGGLLDRCNHLCNFEINKDKMWENANYVEYERDVFGSSDYPFSECSQGRAAWQERERGRRCSLSEEARQHRVKQTEAHHRWMKRNRIHDSTYGTGSDDDDFFNVYHQSAAANALLYVGLGTVAIGSIIFFVGTGEKGFKTLELRLIGPTLVACGLLCCLIRVLLCACPSTCLRRRKKERLKDNTCPHAASRYPKSRDHIDFHMDSTALLSKTKKKVSIVPPSSNPLPSTSTYEFKENDPAPVHSSAATSSSATHAELLKNVPQINLPSSAEDDPGPLKRDQDSIIELQSFDLVYDMQSVSSYGDSDEEEEKTAKHHQPSLLDDAASSIQTNFSSGSSTSKLTRTREPVNTLSSANRTGDDNETCLSVVIERSDNSESSDNTGGAVGKTTNSEKQQTHSGIVLSPLQLGQ